MIRIYAFIILVLSALPLTHVQADILQGPDYYQFRYSVDLNGGTFIYPPGPYFNPGYHETETHYHDPTKGSTADYDAVALGELVEFTAFPGEIRMNAMAKGPDNGINPEDGLRVQAYAEVIPVGLGASHGVDVSQQVVSWISRRFTVAKEGDYTLDAYLNGESDFDAFDNGITYQATYAVMGEVTLEELVIVGQQVIEIKTVPGFPVELDEDFDSQSIEAHLVVKNEEQQDVTYQLKVVLKLTSRLINFNYGNGQIQGALAGDYQLADENQPFELVTTVIQNDRSTGLSGMRTLLLMND